MKLAVMQPYFFPYIGYWQLINSVDTFVIFDDVNFINKGFINRNYIYNNGRPLRINLPLSKASQTKLINEIDVLDNKSQLIKNLTHCYAKAPYFSKTIDILKKIIMNSENNLARYLGDSIKILSEVMDIETQFIYSSEISKPAQLKSAEKIISIAKNLNAKTYLNPIGGQNLYDKNMFLKEGLNLKFLKPEQVKYQQFGQEFVYNLSIIDSLMFNSPEEIRQSLNEFELV